MIYDRLRVFVSSKMAELREERQAVRAELAELNIDAWVFENDAGARPDTIEESFVEELDRADLYLGMFWKGYGQYTIDEFEHAQKTGKDCLIYQKGGDDVAERDPELSAFLQRIGKVETGLTIRWFQTVDELREMVKADAARWQTSIVRKYRDEGAARRGVDPNLVLLRDRVQSAWIDGVLARSIYETGLVDLRSERRAASVDPSLEAVLDLPDDTSRVVEAGSTPLSIYDEVGGSLLVLGQPGSGKTTTALRLARELIRRSERDRTAPVPVVLNLSTWSTESCTLLTWLTREISAKYQMPGLVTRPWLLHDRLVLILDGLDEVPAEARAACVGAINSFVEEFGCAGLVVTSRRAEYDALPVQLKTGGAISLQPLGPEQIEAFLGDAGPELAGLATALKGDGTLRELARSPLMLGVMAQAYRGKPAEEISTGRGRSAAARTDSLFSTYVDRAFDSGHGDRRYTREAMTSWLSWLARGMQKRGRSMFLIEELEPDWLETRAQRAGYLALFAVLIGAIYGSLVVLFRLAPPVVQTGAEVEFGKVAGVGEVHAWYGAVMLWLLGIGLTDRLRSVRLPEEAGRFSGETVLRVVVNLVLYALLWVPLVYGIAQLDIPNEIVLYGIPSSLVLGAAALGARRSLTRSIETTERLAPEWRWVIPGALIGFVIGVGFALKPWLDDKWTTGGALLWTLGCMQLVGVLASFRPQVVRGKTLPNQGMRLTWNTAWRAALMAWIPAATVALLCALFGDEGIYSEPRMFFAWALWLFVFGFVNILMWFGGLDLGKHLIVRALVGTSRQGPWDFAGFLNEATRRQLIQRVGGGYIFVHRLLLEHFAALDLPPPARSEAEIVAARQGAFPFGVRIALGALLFALLFAGFAAFIGNAAVTHGALVGAAFALLWLVIRSSVYSALRGAQGRSDNE